MQDSVVDDEVVMYNDIQSGEHRFLVAYCVCDASFCRDILSEALPISSFHPLFGLSHPSPFPFIFNMFHDSKYRHARHSYSLSSIYKSHREKFWADGVVQDSARKCTRICLVLIPLTLNLNCSQRNATLRQNALCVCKPFPEHH